MKIVLMARVGALFLCCVTPRYLCAEEGKDAEPGAREVLEILEATLASSTTIYPIDCVVNIESSTEFDGTPTAGSSTTYRLQLDPDKRWACWMGTVQVRSSDPATGKESKGILKFFGATVSGSTLTRFSFGRSGEIRHATFKQALAEAGVPLPHFWTVTRYPIGGSPQTEFLRVTSLISDPRTNAKVTRDTKGNLVCYARHEIDDKKFDIYQWNIELPDYLCSRFHIDRARNGTPRRYWEQDLLWGEVDDVAVPTHVLSETIAVRPGNGIFELGKQSEDVEIGWLSAGKKLPVDDNMRKLGYWNAGNVMEFIKEGKKVSSQR